MQSEELKSLFSKVFGWIVLWSVQSVKRSIITLFLFVVAGIPLLGYLQILVRNIHYYLIIDSLLQTLVTFSITSFVIFFTFSILFIIFLYLYLELNKSRKVNDGFNRGLNKWARTRESGWTVQRCNDKTGWMLSVTNSEYPGILKEAYNWYDYQTIFEAKIQSNTNTDKENFTFVVRAENNYNGVVFQVTRTHVKPMLLYESTYILDTENNQKLPTMLALDSWIKTSVRVKGDDVEITLDGFTVKYRIPSIVLNYTPIERLIAGSSITLTDLKTANNEIENDVTKITETPTKKNEDKKRALDKLPNFSKVIIEYQRGSFGFREGEGEQAYFSSFTLNKIIN